MEASNIKQQFKNNKWLRYGAVIPVIILLVLVFFWVKSWFAPREPVVPSNWSQEIVSYWAFEKPKGQTIKDTANKNNGQLGGSINPDKHDPERTEGKLGAGLEFQGEDYSLVPYDEKLNLKEEVTLEAWVKPQASSANEDLWLSDWKYRKRIILTNEEGEDFKNAQVKLILNTKELIEQNKLQSDCKDLRFTKTNKTTKLDWYIEDGCNSTTTEVWVKVPKLKAKSEKPIYTYYGNFEADSQSGYKQAMEVPPIESWKWPNDRRINEEKVFSVDISSKDHILTGGYQNRRAHEGQEWKTVELTPNGQGFARTYFATSGANQINDVEMISKEEKILVGFDNNKGNSRWRIRRKSEIDKKNWTYTKDFSNGSDRATAIGIGENEDVVVGGYDSSRGDAQWRVMRFNKQGEEIWTYTNNPSSGADIINDLAIDSKGNILVVGVDKKKGHDQWRLTKLSPKGDLIYSYLLDISNKSDVLSEVEVDSQDNILLGGSDFKPGNFQWHLIKLNPDGERIWNYKKDFSSGTDKIKAMAIDAYDNILVGGYDYKPGDAQWRVERLNPEGKKDWSYVKNPSSNFDEVNGIAVDSKDDIILAGVTDSKPEILIEKISEKKYYNLDPEIKILDEQTFQEISSLVVGKLDSYGLRVNEGEVTASVNNNLISTDLGTGWSHLMLTYDGNQQSLYVNSELKNSQSLSGNINTNYNNLLLGFNYSGLLDEVKVYNKALTSEEVQQVYQNF